MGSITAALARGVVAHGGEILTDAPVVEILVNGDRVEGVRLADGSEFRAKAVMSNADPKHTLGKLVPTTALSSTFRDKVARIDVRGSMARLHLLLDELPQYIGFPNAELGPQHRGHAILGGSEERFEEAYIAMLRGVFPDEFPIEAIIQSATDPSLAPGKARHDAGRAEPTLRTR